MAENYSLKSSFGLNVQTQGAQNQQLHKNNLEVNDFSKDLFGSMNELISKYDNVFSGEVAHQINMYSRQAMFVGMSLKQGETKRQFDVNI